jgi:hypothetical protein
MSEEIERFARIEPPSERAEPTIRIGLEIEVQTDEGPKIVTVGKVFPAAGCDIRMAMRPMPSDKWPYSAQLRCARAKQRGLIAALIAMRITNLITDGIAAAIDQPERSLPPSRP